MKGKTLKTTIAVLTAMALVLSLGMAGCGKDTKTAGGGDSTAKVQESTQAQAPTSTPEPKKEKTKVDYWYLWTGDGDKTQQEIAKAFNEKQDEYEVIGLSVPDQQKITVAISSGTGPDLTDDFDWNLSGYADKGATLQLDDLISRDKYDIQDFIPAAIDACKYRGKIFALPIGSSPSMLYYNKKLFTDAGLSGPPKDSKEFYDYAVKLTKVKADKTIDVLGFPDFPDSKWNYGMFTCGFGQELISADGVINTSNIGTLTFYKMLYDYRKQFGVSNIQKFQSGGKWLEATDPFIQGKQAMRVDGPWFGDTIKRVLKIDLGFEYGVAPLPYLEGHPETAGGNQLSSSIMYIPAKAKNVEGSWAFLKYLVSSEVMQQGISKGGFPSRISVMNSDEMQKNADLSIFAKAMQDPKVKAFAYDRFKNVTEFFKIYAEEIDNIASLKKTPEQALKDTDDKSNAIK